MSDTNSQKTILAAPGIRTKQYSSGEHQFIQLGADGNQRITGKCLVYLLTIIAVIAAVVLFFSSIVWRITSPRLKLSSLSLQIINSGSNYTSSTNNYDMTILAKLTIENDNFGRFHFDSCKAVVLYGNSTIGGGDIDGGSVGARGTVVMDVAMKVGTTASENWNIASSNNSGFVELISYAKMRGKVSVMKFVKKKLRVEMNCRMKLDLTNQSIHVFLCR